MKIINLFIAITIVILSLFAYFHLTMPSWEERYKNQIAMLQNVINREIDKISIVIYENNNYSYLAIYDKKIIKEFMDILKKDTYIPNPSTGQYGSKYVITLHSKANSDLIKLSSDTFNDSIKSDSVEVTLYGVKDIDIFDLYSKSVINSKVFFSLFIVSYGSGKYSFRNQKLYYFINKYIKGKGLVYNPSTNKWMKR
ncbi:MAG: hypothetical protein CVV49_04190 [Spirochaetae bacterium HGW-Spirochaetae-5]|nr:MAG: hypothetical protein CVV49_04190 [Spirochaetae bacterium HGW-Spirochaetae-5]